MLEREANTITAAVDSTIEVSCISPRCSRSDKVQPVKRETEEAYLAKLQDDVVRICLCDQLEVLD